MESNAPIGLWPELEFEGEEVGDMHGKTLFVYTDASKSLLAEPNPATTSRRCASR
jgi:hypothetical protein